MKFRLRLEQALLRYVVGFMACVGLAYYAGLVCDAWPFLQLQPQRPAPSPHTPAPPSPPPPHPVPDHTIGGDHIYIYISIYLYIYISIYLYIYIYIYIYLLTFGTRDRSYCQPFRGFSFQFCAVIKNPARFSRNPKP